MRRLRQHALIAALPVLCGAGVGEVALQPPMGDPLPGLTADELARFEAGFDAFVLDFSEADGLGPVFNDNSCGSCHRTPVGGFSEITVTRAGRVTKNGFDPLEDLGGSLFQNQAISVDCQEVVPPEATIVAERVSNGMLGYGLVEAIADADLLALADPGDGDGDGISGRAHMVHAIEDPAQTPRVGRFGWKAQVATIMTFSAEAALNETGLTSPFPETSRENDPNGILPPDLGDPDFCDTVPDPEVDLAFLEAITDFQRFLAAPPQTPRSGMAGEAIFETIGCADCHVAAFTTADDPALEAAIRNRLIRPYSDFLLHDMGDGGDGIAQGDAEAWEIRTPPLWGLAIRNPIWHDGRFEAAAFAERVTAAIAAHDDGALSEGRFATRTFAALSEPEQASLLVFLESLGRREFDQNRDDVVNAIDFHGDGAGDGLAGCFGAGPYDADDPCAIHDVDRDGDVDPDDVELFLSVYTGPQLDCNGNAILDLQEILHGTSADANHNALPDECEARGDLDGDGLVMGLDLVLLLGAWGPCPAPPADCPGDLNGDGTVSTIDMLILISNWGPWP